MSQKGSEAAKRRWARSEERQKASDRTKEYMLNNPGCYDDAFRALQSTEVQERAHANHNLSEEGRASQSSKAKEQWKSEDHRKCVSSAVSESNTRRWKINPDKEMARMLKIQKKEGGRKPYFDRLGRKLNLDCYWEFCFAVLLDLLCVDYEYESVTLLDGSGRYYPPDFYLPKYNRYVEVKAYRSGLHYLEVTNRINDVESLHKIVVEIFSYDELKALEAFRFKCFDRENFHFDRERFNDYPFWSSDKRREVLSALEQLLGRRYSLDCTETCSMSATT